MKLYRLSQFNFITRTTDNASIPIDPRNKDYNDYLNWVNQGNQPDPAPLDEYINTRIAYINESYNKAIQNNVIFTNSAGTFEYQADFDSQNILTTTISGLSGANNVPSGFYWRSANNVNVSFTLQDLKGLAETMLMQGWLNFQKKINLIEQIRGANSSNTILSITW